MIRKYILSTLLFLSIECAIYAQVTISGSTCVVSGGELGYLYTATGNLQPSDNLSWNVTGGVVAGSTVSTFDGTVSGTGGQVRIIWNKGIATGKLRLTNGRLGQTEITVIVIGYPNIISLPADAISIGSTVTLSGSAPSSNGCTPLSNCWWEVAESSLGPFREVENATSRNLTITAMAGKRYYRRVLSVNGDVIYSNIILIDPQ